MKSHYNVHLAEVIQSGLDHPECLNFGPDGRLYAGGLSGQAYAMTPPDFELQLLGRSEGSIAGVAVDGYENVYLCHTRKRSVLRMNQNGDVSVFCDRAPDGPVIYPNYGVFDVAGNYYFSDSGSGYWIPNGRLIKVKPNGATESLIGGCWHSPNGLAMSPIDGSLFMIETTAADVIRVPINKDATIGQPEIYVQLQGNELDGLAFAKNGNLYVSCYYPNRIFVIHPDRNIELLIEDTTGEILNQPTNVAFEPNGTRLFFANLGGQHIGALDVGEHGAALCYPKL
jgi:gluconolactonase